MSIGLATAVINELRRKHFRAGLRTILLEATDANRCPQSENLSAWTKSAGTGSAIPGQADPFGGTSAYKLDDQDGGIEVNWRTTLAAYTNSWTSRGFSFYVKADTAAAADVGFRDETAGVYRLRITVTNTGGVITAAINSGSGSIVAVIPSTNQPGWYRVLVQVTGLTIGNTHAIYLRPAGQGLANVGAMLFWGIMAHDRGGPAHSYVQNNTAGSTLCNGDDLQLPWLTAPGALSLYVAYRETGGQLIALAENVSARMLQIAAGNAQPRLILMHPATAQVRIQYENLTQALSVTTVGAPTLNYGDFVEVFAWMYADASAQIGVAVNGSAIILSPRGSALSAGFPIAYDPAGLVANQRVQGASSLGAGFMELKALGVFPGVYTPDELRSQAAQVA